MTSATSVPGFNSNSDLSNSNLSPLLAVSCKRACSGGEIYMQTETSKNCECSFLFVSLRNGAQTGEQQADNDRRGPFSRKSRCLTNANPPHYSQRSLANCGSFP